MVTCIIFVPEVKKKKKEKGKKGLKEFFFSSQLCALGI